MHHGDPSVPPTYARSRRKRIAPTGPAARLSVKQSRSCLSVLLGLAGWPDARASCSLCEEGHGCVLDNVITALS